MVREICVHEHHELAGAELDAIDVCGAQPHFASSLVHCNLVLAVMFLKCQSHGVGAIRTAVFDDDHLEVQVA